MDNGLSQSLQQLIEAIKNIAPMVWSALIRQSYIDGALGLAWIIAGVILFVKFSLPAPHKVAHYHGVYLDADTGSDKEQFAAIMSAVWFCGGIVSLIVFVVAIAMINTTVTSLVNPEFSAIKYLISVVTK